MTASAPHLAFLLAAPQPGETAMHRDQLAMAEALLGRGFAADDILCLHGRLDRTLVLAALQAVSRRVAGWTVGSVFVHVSGHGFFTGDTRETARPGLLFRPADLPPAPAHRPRGADRQQPGHLRPAAGWLRAVFRHDDAGTVAVIQPAASSWVKRENPEFSDRTFDSMENQ